MRIETDYSLLPHNTFGIPARCARFCEYDNVEELRELLIERKSEQNLLHIGSGSNLLFTKDFDGTILHSAINTFEITEETESEVVIRVGAGMDWDALVAKTIEHKFYGLENLSLIPGEVGASAVQNIGAYGAEIEQFIEKVETFDIDNATTHLLSHSDCNYAYRHSIFKASLKGKHIVTHVRYHLKKHFVPNLSYAALQHSIETAGYTSESITAAQLRQVVINVRLDKLPDPLQIGSAGSFFMNPIISKTAFSALQKQYPTLPFYPAGNGIKVPAGWLVQEAGWKGKSLGKAGVWHKQALVLVNNGGAKGEEIVALSQAIQTDVKEKFGIMLQPEVNFI